MKTRTPKTKQFNHPKGRVEWEGVTVRLYVTTDDGAERLRQERVYPTEGRADLAFWDAVDWLRKLRG